MSTYIYLYLFLIFCLLFKKNIFLFLISYIYLLFLGGFRSFETGTDVNNYYQIFKYIQDGGESFSFAAKIVEPGWFIINWLCAVTFNDFRAVLFVSIFLSTLPIFIRAWNYREKTFSIILYYVLLFFYLNSYNIMRQMIAVSFVFYSLLFLEQKKMKKFYILIMMASLFHYSALFCLIFPYYLRKIKLSLPLVLTFIVVTYIAGVYILPIIFSKLPFIGKYSFYLMNDSASGSLSRLLLNIFFIFIYATCHYAKKNIYLKLFFAGILIYNILAFSPAAARLALYFIVAQLSLFPFLDSKFYWNKIALKTLSFLYASIYYFTMLLANSGEIVPYELG